MSDEQAVKAVHPTAHVVPAAIDPPYYRYLIRPGTEADAVFCLGGGDTEALAWRNARTHLGAEGRGLVATEPKP